MADGFIVINRKITEWEWFDSPMVFYAWIHILIDANWKDGRWHGVDVPRGSFITSTRKLADELNLDHRTVSKILKKLESTGEISIKKHEKCMVIKVNKYADFQHYRGGNVPTDVPVNVPINVPVDVPVNVPMDAHNRTNKQINNRKENNKEKILPGSQANTDDTYLSTKTATVGREEKADVNTATVMRATEEAMEVIDYLNSQTGSHYRHTKGNIRHVTARINEGFTVQDCKTVIDKKCAEWMPDDRMQQYLRPETLFGPKFENYLNQRVVKYSSDRSGQGRKEISLPDYMNRPQPGPEEDPDLLAELLEWQKKGR